MKKIFLIILSFLFCFVFEKVHASEYITYSDYQEEYPSWLNSKFIESEDRYLWYREIINEETNEVEREETQEYYKELEGYIKIEESKKTFYRYITNPRVILDGSGNLVYDDAECAKMYCVVVRMPTKPVEEIIENPKTYDNIFVFLIIAFISFISIVLLLDNYKINLVLSNRFKKI